MADTDTPNYAAFWDSKEAIAVLDGMFLARVLPHWLADNNLLPEFSCDADVDRFYDAGGDYEKIHESVLAAWPEEEAR